VTNFTGLASYECLLANYTKQSNDKFCTFADAM